MNRLPSHDHLSNRFTLRGVLVAESAVHVGSGEAGAAAGATDMPVARDGRGRPYLPGSSFRGAFRASLESLLRGLGRQEIRVCDPFDKQEESPHRSCSERVLAARKAAGEENTELTEQAAFDLAWKESCEICRLFGHLFLASRVRIADLPLTAEADDSPTYVRDGVGLDRDLRNASRNILYTFEAVVPETRFDLRLELENGESHEVGLLLTGLDLFKEGFARIGGKSSRGLGLARLDRLEVTQRTARDFFQGTPGLVSTPETLDDHRKAARAYYLGGNG
jgi:CRISPR-associated protein Csm3